MLESLQRKWRANELPLAMECRVKSFENGILVGEIVNVSVDESVVTDGSVDITKVKPISFDPFGNAYFGVGAKGIPGAVPVVCSC